MNSRLRLDYPQEVVRERREVYDQIRVLLAEQTLPALQQAKRLHLDWLRRYPEDYIALDAGEILAMSESAYEAMQDNKPEDYDVKNATETASHSLNSASG